MWKIPVLSVPQNTVVDLNNVMLPPGAQQCYLTWSGVRLTFGAATRAVRSSGRLSILGTRPNPWPPPHHNGHRINTVQSHSNRRTRNWSQSRRERPNSVALLDAMSRLRVWRLVVRRDSLRANQQEGAISRRRRWIKMAGSVFPRAFQPPGRGIRMRPAAVTRRVVWRNSSNRCAESVPSIEIVEATWEAHRCINMYLYLHQESCGLVECCANRRSTLLKISHQFT